MFKSGTVAVTGRANAGKSTLINALIGEKVSIVSPKPQTTRTAVRGIYNDEGCQIVFADVPGLHNAKTGLGREMTRAINSEAFSADCVLFLLEANSRGLLESEKKLLASLNREEIPVILVITKIDLFEKKKMLPVIADATSQFEFKTVIPISSRKKDGLDIVIEEICKFIPEGEAIYPEDEYTDMTMKEMLSETIREKALLQLGDEVPHGIAVEITKFEEGDDIIKATAEIYCERKSHKGIIIGKGGAMLKKIAESARLDAEKAFGTRIFLECWVKVREDWRNSESSLSEFGFRKKSE
ncbi:MAG: GTPase Era [Clostridia bacterium]|nr:GTPase Era [Clostridia bacterium]